MIDFENCLCLIQGMVCYVSRELCVISQWFACNGLLCTQILHGIYPEICVDLSRELSVILPWVCQGLI